MSFSIDWNTPAVSVKDTQGRLPNVSYTFVLIKLGLAWPFVQLMDRALTLGAHLNFDVRPVTGNTGDIEDPKLWYGPAKKNGLSENIYLIPVTRLSDTEVKDYFYRKSQLLIKALESSEMPPPCSSEESWGGKRCQGYCDVAEFCPDASNAMLSSPARRVPR